MGTSSAGIVLAEMTLVMGMLLAATANASANGVGGVSGSASESDTLVLTAAENEFNQVLKNQAILMISFLGLYAFSVFILARLVRNTEHHQTLLNVPFSLCVGALSVILFLQIMLPITFIGNEFRHYYEGTSLKIFSSDLFVVVWTGIFHLSAIFLFGCLPFAYFYNEASHDFNDRILNKLSESLSQSFLVGILLAVVVYIFQVMFRFQGMPPQWGLHLLPFLFTALVSLKAFSRGFTLIFNLLLSEIMKDKNPQILKEQLETTENSIAVIKSRLNQQSRHVQLRNAIQQEQELNNHLSPSPPPPPTPLDSFFRAPHYNHHRLHYIKPQDTSNLGIRISEYLEETPSKKTAGSGDKELMKKPMIMDTSTGGARKRRWSNMRPVLSLDNLEEGEDEDEQIESSSPEETEEGINQSPSQDCSPVRNGNEHPKNIGTGETDRVESVDSIDRNDTAKTLEARGKSLISWILSSKFLTTTILGVNAILLFIFLVLLLMNAIQELIQIVGLNYWLGKNRILNNKGSGFGLWSALIHAILAYYLDFVLFLGFYSLSEFSWIFNQSFRKTEGMTTPELIYNLALVLAVSMSIPGIIELLGVGSNGVWDVYVPLSFIRGYPLLTFTYKIAVAALTFHPVFVLSRKHVPQIERFTSCIYNQLGSWFSDLG